MSSARNRLCRVCGGKLPPRPAGVQGRNRIYCATCAKLVNKYMPYRSKAEALKRARAVVSGEQPESHIFVTPFGRFARRDRRCTCEICGAVFLAGKKTAKYCERCNREMALVRGNKRRCGGLHLSASDVAEIVLATLAADECPRPPVVEYCRVCGKPTHTKEVFCQSCCANGAVDLWRMKKGGAA